MGLKFSKIKEWCQKKFKTLMSLLIYDFFSMFFSDQLPFGIHCKLHGKKHYDHR